MKNIMRTAMLICVLMTFQWSVDVTILKAQTTKLDSSSQETGSDDSIRVLSFNILQGGGNAGNVGFDNDRFDGSRMDEIADVIRMTRADVVGIQEDVSGHALLDQLSRDTTWYRYGSVYSKFELEGLEKSDKAYGLTACRIKLPNQGFVTFVNCHWHPSPWGPDLVQTALKNGDPTVGTSEFALEILKKSGKPDGYRGYQATIDLIKKYQGDGPVLVTGDFNEPSHLDWTERFANEGFDRWVRNPTETPLRFEIAWTGSKLLGELGLTDAYRHMHPDEVAKPGITWTPAYPEGTSGRRPPGDQVHDRIDIVYFSSRHWNVDAAHVVGEDGQFSDVVFDGPWPSDHRAVVAELGLIVDQ